MPNNEADKLKKRRGGIRSTVTTDISGIEAMLDGSVDGDPAKLRTTMKRLNHNLSRLYELDGEVQGLLTGGEVDKDVTASEQFNDKVLYTVVKIDEVLLELAAGVSSPASGSASVPQAVRAPAAPTFKLPKFEMASYSGDPLGWLPFWDVFKAAVHNKSLAPVEKLSYLLGYLEGDALRMVDGYSLTADNYDQVIKQLHERFGNKQRAQFAHYQALIALEPAKNKGLTEVRRVWDKCETHIRSLVALGDDEDQFGVVFTSIILSKLPEYLATKLCESREGRSRSVGVDQGAGARRPQTTTAALPAPGGRSDQHQAFGYRQQACFLCSGTNHRAADCDRFATVNDRYTRLKETRKCFVCLQQHLPGQCRRTYPCNICSRPGHNEALCKSKDPNRFQRGWNSGKKEFQKKPQHKKESDADKPCTPKKTAANVALTLDEDEDKDVAFLQTALADISNKAGTKTMKARLLMDTASSRTYVTEDCAKRLGVKKVGETYVSVGRFGSTRRETRTCDQVVFDVVCSDGSVQPVLAIVTPVISCPISRVPIDLEEHPVVKKLQLAEPLNAIPDDLKIDVLIGSDQFFNFMSSGTNVVSDSLVFVNSRLGYLTAGTMSVKGCKKGAPETTLVLLQPDVDVCPLDHSRIVDVEKFWKLEEVGTKESKLADLTDEETLRQFQDTVEFNDGRYHVTWPWKSKEPDLQNNYGLAQGRLRSTWNRLQKDPKLLDDYDGIIRKQIENGIVEKAPMKPEGMVYYMPHQPVIKPQRSTTKVRIVHDASSKARKDLLSLNDCLHRGMVILSNLAGLLLRFRLHAVALVSDIEKAFLQVRLQSQERDVARFLWVKDITKPPTGQNVEHWRFTSVFFGSVSSSFLLGATIDTHLRRSDGKVTKKIRENLYVDNVITGEEDAENAIDHYREAKSLFLGASMNLREFFTNSTEENEVVKITKRRITERVAEVYDPCGWFSPVLLTGKLLVQELWKLNLTWDEPVPDEIAQRWTKIERELFRIAEGSIPRFIGTVEKATFELHTFCDSSKAASAAVVYLRTVVAENAKCDMLFSKTRLAPLKPQQTIPRLELVALVMGSNMIEFVEEQLKLTIAKKFVWSDSQCTLCWLNKEKLGTKFVERRVEEIRQKKGIEFRYVPTKQNPADLPSRGCTFDELQQNPLWLHGPDWLLLGPENWPKDRTASVSEFVTELAVVDVRRPTAILNPQV